MDSGHLSQDFCWKILAILEQDQVKWSGVIPERSSCDENKICPSTESGVDTIMPGGQSWDEIIAPVGHIYLV